MSSGTGVAAAAAAVVRQAAASVAVGGGVPTQQHQFESGQRYLQEAELLFFATGLNPHLHAMDQQPGAVPPAAAAAALTIAAPPVSIAAACIARRTCIEVHVPMLMHQRAHIFCEVFIKIAFTELGTILPCLRPSALALLRRCFPNNYVMGALHS